MLSPDSKYHSFTPPRPHALAAWALGTATGVYAHNRDSPLIHGVLPHGFTVGFKKEF